ncbi:MAG: glycosyl transferase, partial [Sediminibacterium sp.]|nr:glycosyl transferase [Sediminibacterium sp.]
MKPAFLLLFTGVCFFGFSQPVIYVNQVGFDASLPKMAVIGTDKHLPEKTVFTLTDLSSGKAVFTAPVGKPQTIAEWAPGKFFYQADFSSFKKPGNYRISMQVGNLSYQSYDFKIGENVLAKLTIPSIAHYYRKQRANTPEELAVDNHIKLYGTNKPVNVTGGWCDASGDVSKYFSHLAYANFMSPQQTPLVTWSLINTTEAIPDKLTQWNIKDSMEQEAFWGADYMMRCLS